MHRRIYTCFRLYHYEINLILIPMSMPANYRHFPRQKVNHGKFIINFTSSKVYDSRAFLAPKKSPDILSDLPVKFRKSPGFVQNLFGMYAHVSEIIILGHWPSPITLACILIKLCPFLYLEIPG